VYDANVCVSSPDACVNEDELAEIEGFANRVENAMTATTGELIRGLGPVSLDNELVASLVETAVGVIGRKVVEKVGWCYFCVAGSNTQPTDIVRVTIAID
jgi:hypothetical protein